MEFAPDSLPSIPPTSSSSKSRRRAIASCDVCRRRKVKCDQQHPTCSACRAVGRVCLYTESSGSQFGVAAHRAGRDRAHSIRRRPRDSPHLDTLDVRLGRLESVLEQIIQAKYAPQPTGAELHQAANGERGSASAGAPANVPLPPPPPPPGRHLRAEESGDGTLLVSEDGGSQFVSSQHWSLLATELRDIREMLTSGRDSVAAQFLPSDEHDIVRCLPRDGDACYELLQVFEGNVDPVLRIVHKPTLRRRFKLFVDEYTDFLSIPPLDREDNMEERLKKDGLLHFRPLLFAIFFASVNSLSDTAVITQFGLEKRRLMATYQRGLQLSLLAIDAFNSVSIELLQAYTLFLSCQLRDETVGRTYSLLAAVTRQAMSLGLHREPTLFSPVPDEVTVEVRRRVWAQLRYVEWRAGELKGFLQSYDDDAFSTRLPRNVNDGDLIAGRVPGLLDPSLAAEEGRYTETTLQVCLYRMVQCARQVGHSVHNQFRKTAQPSSRPAEVRIAEFDVLRQEMEKLIASARERNMRHCRFDDNTLTAPQKLAKMNTKIMEWKCWLVFWCGIPREQRKTLLSNSDRMKLLRDSVALVETLNEVALDPGLEKFRWVVLGCSAFQTVMVLIAELRDTQPISEEEVTFRLHALRTLRQTVTIHEGSESRAWAVISKYVEQLESTYRQFAGPERQQPNPEMMTGRSVRQGLFDGYPADNEILQSIDFIGLGWGNGYQGLWPE